MPAVKPITPGDRFGRWTALNRTEFRAQSGTRVSYHECRCDCGIIQFVNIYKLRTGHSRSCGCLIKEITAERSKTHGLSKTRVYRIWSCMITRCTNPKNNRYERYGGRGITVCERWLKFENFFEDMGEPPDGHSIDRLNNDAGYSKENCAWHSASQQAKNKSNNVSLTFEGVTQSLIGWAIRLGIPYRTLIDRRAAGWSVEDTLSTPHHGKRKGNI